MDISFVTSYMGHRQLLPKDHPFQYDDARFNGNMERRCALKPLSESAMLAVFEGITFTYDKGETRHMDIDESKDQQIWKKKKYIF